MMLAPSYASRTACERPWPRAAPVMSGDWPGPGRALLGAAARSKSRGGGDEDDNCEQLSEGAGDDGRFQLLIFFPGSCCRPRESRPTVERRSSAATTSASEVVG